MTVQLYTNTQIPKFRNFSMYGMVRLLSLSHVNKVAAVDHCEYTRAFDNGFDDCSLEPPQATFHV